MRKIKPYNDKVKFLTQYLLSLQKDINKILEYLNEVL
jgi:hypothetical protein